MTCKDCIHNSLCGTFTRPCYPDEVNASERLCKDFKNKADFVEVTRCKNCKQFIKKGEEFLKDDVFGVCEKSRTGFFDDGEEVYGNDFCSYGERRDT